jgi:hypothetical protein
MKELQSWLDRYLDEKIVNRSDNSPDDESIGRESIDD